MRSKRLERAASQELLGLARAQGAAKACARAEGRLDLLAS